MLRSAALPALVALAALAVGCGGGDDTGAVDDLTTTIDATTTIDDAPTTIDVTTTSTTSTTTTTTIPEVAAVAPDEIHDLVVAWSDGTGEPLILAERIAGFPLAVPVPDGTTALRLSVDLAAHEPTDPFRLWRWSYEALAPGPVADVDITLGDNGPGSAELRTIYDPVFADLGWSYSNSTGSDPGELGGPNSINHVYRSDAGSLVVAGVDATPRPTFVWLDEDAVFGDEQNPGYQVDVTLEIDHDVVPVPLLATLAEALPLPESAELHRADLTSLDRAPDSFAASEGLRYLQVTLEWRLAPGTEAEAQDLFTTALDGEVLQRGEESFFDEGTIELVDPRIVEVPDVRWEQPVIVVGRYEGTLGVGNDGIGPTARLTVVLEPNRERLAPAPS